MPILIKTNVELIKAFPELKTNKALIWKEHERWWLLMPWWLLPNDFTTWEAAMIHCNIYSHIPKLVMR